MNVGKTLFAQVMEFVPWKTFGRYLAPRAVLLDFDGLAPRLALAGVDLAEVQHLALRHTPVAQAPILDKVPVLMGLAVLDASGAAQEHGPSLYEAPRNAARTKVFTTSDLRDHPFTDQALASAKRPKSQESNGELRKSG